VAPGGEQRAYGKMYNSNDRTKVQEAVQETLEAGVVWRKLDVSGCTVGLTCESHADATCILRHHGQPHIQYDLHY